MWICLNDAFVSAVRDKDNPSRLCVRARKRAHLERLFPQQKIVETPDADYACRVFMTKAEFTEALAVKIEGIGYTNFKDSVRDRRLHELYASFWLDHWIYQHRDSERSKRFTWDTGDLVQSRLAEPDG